jgi:hypothetical protein
MENFDFGFTVVADNEIAAVGDKVTQLENAVSATIQAEARLTEMFEMIMPLLNNLKGDPAQDYIHWPGAGRHKKIDEFIVKLNDV